MIRGIGKQARRYMQGACQNECFLSFIFLSFVLPVFCYRLAVFTSPIIFSKTKVFWTIHNRYNSLGFPFITRTNDNCLSCTTFHMCIYIIIGYFKLRFVQKYESLIANIGPILQMDGALGDTKFQALSSKETDWKKPKNAITLLWVRLSWDKDRLMGSVLDKEKRNRCNWKQCKLSLSIWDFVFNIYKWLIFVIDFLQFWSNYI